MTMGAFRSPALLPKNKGVPTKCLKYLDGGHYVFSIQSPPGNHVVGKVYAKIQFLYAAVDGK